MHKNERPVPCRTINGKIWFLLKELSDTGTIQAMQMHTSRKQKRHALESDHRCFEANCQGSIIYHPKKFGWKG